MPHVETIEQYLARGGKVTVCPSAGSGEMLRREGVVRRITRTHALIAAGEGTFCWHRRDFRETKPQLHMRVSFEIIWRHGERRAIRVQESAARV